MKKTNKKENDRRGNAIIESFVLAWIVVNFDSDYAVIFPIALPSLDSFTSWIFVFYKIKSKSALRVEIGEKEI